MSRRFAISLFLFLCLVTGMHCFSKEEPVRHQITQWVQQLGNDSFLVRQRAETLLIRAGVQAYPELQRARRNSDVEIVRRAEYILSQIEQTFLDMENRETAYWIRLYTLDPNPAGKARIIWALADPYLDLVKGEGLQTLIRLVRFEENISLRLEAAKSLIASPPFAPMARQKWYQHVRDTTNNTGDDELLTTLTDYAKLWCDLDDVDKKITQELQDQVRQVSAATLRLLERQENRIQSGSKIDILLHYAIAELQEAVGLLEDRDATVSRALAIDPGAIQTAEPIAQIALEDGLLMNEHYHVGWYLKQRYRDRWAIAHLQRVMESGEVSLRLEASKFAAESAILLMDYTAAIAFFDKHIEIIRGPDHERGDGETVVTMAQRRQAYCLAEKAAAVGNWEGVRETIVKTWAKELPGNRDISGIGGNIDLLIVAHRLSKQLPDIDHEFRDAMDFQFRKIWNSIIAHYDSVTTPDLRQINMVIAFNWAAWLLANTDGDYQSALTLVEAALKIEPDDIAILDTLAHVYFLGGNVDEAIRIQEQVVRFAPDAVVFQHALEQFKKKKAADSAL